MKFFTLSATGLLLATQVIAEGSGDFEASGSGDDVAVDILPSVVLQPEAPVVVVQQVEDLAEVVEPEIIEIEEAPVEKIEAVEEPVEEVEAEEIVVEKIEVIEEAPVEQIEAVEIPAEKVEVQEVQEEAAPSVQKPLEKSVRKSDRIFSEEQPEESDDSQEISDYTYEEYQEPHEPTAEEQAEEYFKHRETELAEKSKIKCASNISIEGRKCQFNKMDMLAYLNADPSTLHHMWSLCFKLFDYDTCLEKHKKYSEEVALYRQHAAVFDNRK